MISHCPILRSSNNAGYAQSNGSLKFSGDCAGESCWQHSKPVYGLENDVVEQRRPIDGLDRHLLETMVWRKRLETIEGQGVVKREQSKTIGLQGWSKDAPERAVEEYWILGMVWSKQLGN